MKKAILAVSFGTTVAEADRLCIRPIEDALRAAYPEYEVRRAIQSRMIADRLERRGERTERLGEALDRLNAEGFGEIAVAPLFVIPGGEYDRACEAAAGLKIAGPLLSDSTDLEWMASLLADIAREEKRPLLAMGHGADHSGDSLYARLSKILPENVFLACMEGEHTLETALPALEALPERSLTVLPLMLVAGTHAREYLTDGHPDSWKTRLAARGFDVRIRMQGLGMLRAVQQRFVEKLAEVL